VRNRMAESRSSTTSGKERKVNVSDERSQSGTTRKAAGEKNAKQKARNVRGVELTDKRATAPAELSETYNKKNRGRGNIFVCSPKCPNQLWDTISLLFNKHFFLEKTTVA